MRLSRRIQLIFCLCAAASVSLAPPPARAADAPDLGIRKHGVDWPQFLGPTGDSKSPEKGIVTDWPAAGPKILWYTKLGEGYCMPSISKGRLFAFDRIGREDRLRCLESETGKQLWEFRYPTDYVDIIGYDKGPRAQPLVDGDRLYILGPQGMLHCLDVVHGKVLWKLDTAEKFHVIQNFFGVGASPVIEGNLLIMQVGGSPAENHLDSPDQLNQAHGNGSGVVALDKMTGEVKYQFSDELASYATPTLATIAGRRWGFVFARGGLIGFDPTSGKQDFFYPWRAKELYSVNASTPVVVGDQVFISECYQIGSSLLKPRPGGYNVVWSDSKRDHDSAGMKLHWNTAIAVDGYLYGSSGRQTDSAELRCVELATGKVQWSQDDLGRVSLLYVDGHFVSLGEAGHLQLLRVNPKKYEVVASAHLAEPSIAGLLQGADNNPQDASPDDPSAGDPPGAKGNLLKYPCWAAPILSHGLLYVRGRDRLACLEIIPELPSH